MNAAPRRQASLVTREMVPVEPGVYAWYRNGERIYVGKADSLRARVFGNHLRASRSLTCSAFRRNVAEHLGIASSARIKSGAVVLTEAQLADVRAWIVGCEVAWLACDSKAEAIDLESRLKKEFRPPLTKL